MNKPARIIAACVLCLLPSLLSAETAAAGVFNYDPALGVQPLDGEWDFYWKDFIDPIALEAGTVPAGVPAKGRIPGNWTEYGIPEAGGEGYGSYVLRVTGLEPGTRYGIKLGAFLTAARCFAEGIEVFAQGSPGTSREAETARWDSYVAEAKAGPDGAIDLVIHASNFHDRFGGNTKPILFGPYKLVEARATGLVIYDVFFFAALLAMGLYYLMLFFFRPADRSALWFALICLLLALRSISYGEFFLQDLFPGIGWELLAKVGTLTFSLPILLFFLFLKELYPEALPKPAFHAFSAAPLLYSIAIGVLETRIFSLFLFPFQLYVVVACVAAFAVLIRALIRRSPGAGWILGGFAALFFGMVHDMMLVQYFLQDIQLAPIGLMAVVFALSLAVTRKFAIAYAAAESLSGSFQHMNLSLKRLIPADFLRYLKEPPSQDPGLSLRRATVLYAGACGERREAGAAPTEEQIKAEGRILKRIAPFAREGGGFVDRYIGEGFLAIFPDRPDEALRVAIKMRKAASHFNSEQALSGKEAVFLKIGLHTGYLAFPEGEEEPRSIGDQMPAEIAMAAQSEAIAKEFGAGIVLGEGSLTLLEDPSKYRTRLLGRFPKLRSGGARGRGSPREKDEVAAFEVYDGDTDEDISKKDAIRGPFEKALSAFMDGRKPEALAAFKACLTLYPEDVASKRYIELLEG